MLILVVIVGLGIFSQTTQQAPAIIQANPTDNVVSAELLLRPQELSVVPGFLSADPSESYVLRQAEPVIANAAQISQQSWWRQDEEIRVSSLLGLDVRTIVIDPGHGGRDSGAVGQQRSLEKDLTLDIALRLKRILSANTAYKVLLTRSEDRFMSLSQRVAFANQQQADLFISLHFNSLPQRNVNLTETFFYGPTSDQAALELARFENQNSGYSTAEYGKLFDLLSERSKEQESNLLAAQIQQTLFENLNENHVNISNGGTKVAPFAVLLGVQSPAILVEISCISHEQEEMMLQTPAYRRQIANNLKQGIVTYLEHRNEF